MIKQIVPFVAFVFLFFAADAATLRYGNSSVILDPVKKTSPSMAFLLDGVTYYAPLIRAQVSGKPAVNYNGAVYSIASEILWHEETSINSCNSSLILPAGNYRVEMRGGAGGAGGSSGGAGLAADTVSQSFSLSSDVVAYVFRGGDGNAGTDAKTNGSNRNGGGGGASGAPSMVTAGGIVIKSEGGAGGIGISGTSNSGEVLNCGGGGGGSYNGTNSNGMNAAENYAWSNNFYQCGAGGGGAPSGIGGKKAGTTYGGDAGGNGTVASGGGGGMAWRITSDYAGGSGGASVSWSCGGQTLYSYGGGGGGAITNKAASGVHLTGVAGGSGSTGASSTSFVRIYRIY